MLSKEELEKYGIPEEEYQKTLAYQRGKLDESIIELWKAIGIEPYLIKICAWISGKF